MAGGMFLFSAVDAMAKYMTDTMHPFQIVWIRQLGLLSGAFFLLGLAIWISKTLTEGGQDGKG